MARSRSLFDDLDTAIATAASLADEAKPPSVSEAPLVSFEQAAADAEKLPVSPPRVVTQPPAAPTLPPSQKRPSSQRLIPSRIPSSPPPAVLTQPRVSTSSPGALSSTQPGPSVASVAASTAPAPNVMSSTPPVPILKPEPPVVTPPPVAMPPAPTRVSSTTVVPPTAASPGAAPPFAAASGATSAPLVVDAPPLVAAPPEVPEPPAAPPVVEEPPPAAAPAAAREPDAHANDDAGDAKKLPPKLPDLTGIASPVVRCERIVSWIAEATGATDVFLADASGYPLAGAVDGVDAKLAGTGLVAASVASLAASIPGNVSSLFELHLGEGPFFQLIGFQAGASVYVVGFTRGAPLTPRQSHAIRLACRHALGDTLKGGLWEAE
jgi:hypothetical protein